jgi:large subunit ribosomal protein L35
MPKQKSHKGILKRIKITGRGKVIRTKAGKSHLMTGTSAKKSRSRRRMMLASGKDIRLLKREAFAG